MAMVAGPLQPQGHDLFGHHQHYTPKNVNSFPSPAPALPYPHQHQHQHSFQQQYNAFDNSHYSPNFSPSLASNFASSALAGPSSPGPSQRLVSSSVASPPASPSPPIADYQTCDPSNYVALDCEFVGTGDFGLNSALARVSIVGYDGEILLDTFCLPAEKVTDYRSWVSGVREADLLGAPTFASVQTQVRDILKGKVLVGHAVYNDLEVLGLVHPDAATRDTALYIPLQQLACTSRPSLRALAKLVLAIDVQSGEHSSIEDARVTMSIFRSHQQAWEQSLPQNPGFLDHSPSQRHNMPPRPVPVVRFPNANMQGMNPHSQPPSPFNQMSRMYNGSPNQAMNNHHSPSPHMNPMLDPRFSAAGLALPPLSSGQPSGVPAYSPPHQRRHSSNQQQSPGGHYSPGGPMPQQPSFFPQNQTPPFAPMGSPFGMPHNNGYRYSSPVHFQRPSMSPSPRRPSSNTRSASQSPVKIKDGRSPSPGAASSDSLETSSSNDSGFRTKTEMNGAGQQMGAARPGRRRDKNRRGNPKEFAFA